MKRRGLHALRRGVWVETPGRLRPRRTSRSSLGRRARSGLQLMDSDLSSQGCCGNVGTTHCSPVIGLPRGSHVPTEGWVSACRCPACRTTFSPGPDTSWLRGTVAGRCRAAVASPCLACRLVPAPTRRAGPGSAPPASTLRPAAQGAAAAGLTILRQGPDGVLPGSARATRRAAGCRRRLSGSASAPTAPPGRHRRARRRRSGRGKRAALAGPRYRLARRLGASHADRPRRGPALRRAVSPTQGWPVRRRLHSPLC